MADCPNCPIRCETLVFRARGGGKDARIALDELSESFRADVRKIIASRLDPEEHDDGEQEAWLRVLSRLDRWDGKGPFCHWLRVVTGHVAIDYGIGRRRATSLTQVLQQEIPVGVSKGVEEVQEVIECIEEAAARLPPDLRRLYDVMTLRVREPEREPMTHEQMAEALGLKIRTFYYKYREMRKRFDHCLNDLPWRLRKKS